MRHKKTPRYWLVMAVWLPTMEEWKLREWTQTKHGEWRSNDRQVYFEDLKEDKIVYSTFDLANIARLHTSKWPKRDKAIAAIKSDQAREQAKQERQAALKASEPAKKLAKLQDDEKRWTRKSKLAQTKLKKIRRAINRLNKSSAMDLPKTPS